MPKLPNYPIPGPPDHRFNDTFVAAVADLIQFYGYPFIGDDSPDWGRLYRHLRAFIYGDDGYGYTREAARPAEPVPPYVEGHQPGREPRGRLCAHADQDGRGMHWLAAGERCTR